MKTNSDLKKQLAGAILSGLLACSPLHGNAQETTENAGDAASEAAQVADKTGGAAGKTSQAPAIVEPKVNAGEIRVDGRITALLSSTMVTIEVVSFTTPAGKTVELGKTKPKNIQLSTGTNYRERADAAKKLAFKDLKLGRRISVIGKDQGSGKTLPAREIVIWPERDEDGESLGVVRVNAETARLMERGREALRLRDATGALRFFLLAHEAAQGSSDTPGQALSLDWMGSAYSELEQPDKAIESYTRAIGLWREAGDGGNEALSLNNLSLVYRRRNEDARAVEMLERATQLLGNSGDKKQFILTWNNLAHAYMSVGEQEKAISALSQVLPLVRGQNDKSEEASTLSDLAYLYAANRQNDRAQAFIEEATPLLGSVEDKSELASSSDSIGLAYAYMGQRDKAREFFRRALAIFNELGDRSRAESTQSNLDRLGGNANTSDDEE